MKIFTALFCLILFSNSLWANNGESLSAGVTAARQGMLEMVADPPMPLFKNKEGDHKWSVQPSYVTVKTDPDEPTIVRLDNSISKEESDFTGGGVSVGYSSSWKDKWASFWWFNFLKLSGEHNTSFENDNTRDVNKISDMNIFFLNLSFGLSYEFFADNKTFSMGFMLGPSLSFMELNGTVNTFKGSASGGTKVFEGEASFSSFLPGLMVGLMFPFHNFDTVSFTPYAMWVYTPEKCAEYTAGDPKVYDQSHTFLGSHPDCQASNGPLNGEVFVLGDFFTIGFQLGYKPWDLSINFSSSIRNLLYDPSSDERDVKLITTAFSLSKSWGKY